MHSLMTPLSPEVTRAAAPRHPGARVAGALLAIATVVALGSTSPAAHAERADRTKPMSVSSSGPTPDDIDLKNHNAVLTGDVIITQGTLEIHADRVQLSEDADGQRQGTAFGSAGHPARFRQKRDGEDEYSEGDATRIEYDTGTNRVRFVGAAHLRMLKGTVVTNQADAALITYDTVNDTIKLSSGEAGNPATGGRTTVVFTPKAASSAPPPKPLELPAPASGPAK